MDKLNVKVIDDGYGDVKYSNGIAKHISSHVTSFKPKPKDEFSLNDIEENKSIYVATEINGKKYTIGDYAASLDPNIKWIGGENKHSDNRFPILMKSILGMMSNQSYEVIDMLAMNLPIRYDTSDRRELLTNIVKGDHNVKVSYDGVNFYEKNIHVKDVLIKKQAFGSFCNLILNDQGGIKNEKLAKGFNVVVDIGARTLNILTVDSMVEQPELTTHTNDGMFEAYGLVADELKSRYDIMIPDGKLPQVIQKGEIKGNDIQPFIDVAYKTHANNIVSILEKMFIHSWGFVDSIIFTGGGSELLKEYLMSAFQYRDVEKHFLGRHSNAEGLRLYALRQAIKNENNKHKLSVRIGR